VPRTLSALDIGLPVYNGGKYLAEAIESLQAQTFADFTLWISDNGSADDSAGIAKRYAAGDRRIKLDIQAENQGAAWNFNHTFRLGSAPLFTWAAHDDLRHPTCLERCVGVLATEPEVVTCYTATRYVDAEGQPIPGPAYDDAFHLRMDRPRPRFDGVIGHFPMHVVFGVTRREPLARTRLMGRFASADRILVSEIALQGQIHKIDEPLFVRRFHDQLSWYPDMTDRQYATWYDPRNAHGFLAPQVLRRGAEYVRGIHHAGLGPVDELACQGVVLRYAAWDHGVLRLRRYLRLLAGAGAARRNRFAGAKTGSPT
jgi:glycosyltransferase involved in cell wall biosynthesis